MSVDSVMDTIHRGASPLGCCRESKTTTTTASSMTDEYAPVQGTAKPSPQQAHRWRLDCSAMSLATSDTYIYVGCESGDIVVLDMDTYEERTRLRGHNGSVYTLILTPCKRFLFSGASDSLLKVWDLKEGLVEAVYTIYSQYDIGDVFSVAWVPSQETLYFGAQNASIQWLKLYETSHTKDPSSLPSNRFDKFFDSRGPGGKLFPQQNAVTEKGGKDEEGGLLLEVPPRNVVQFAHYGYVYSMCVAHIGSTEVLVSGGGDGTVKVWQCQQGRRPSLQHTFEVDDGDSVLSITHQDAFLYCGLASGRVMMFDLDTMQLIRTDTVGCDRVMALAVKNDCLFRGTRKYVSKWDPKHYNRCQWHAHDGLTLAAVITTSSSGCQHLITGGSDASVAMWKIDTLMTTSGSTSGVSTPSHSGIVALDNENMINTLSQFVSYRTVSGTGYGEYIQDCRRCATFLRSLMQHFGAESQLIPVEGNNPIVYGCFKGTGNDDSTKARVLFYGHYDVIVADDVERWKTEPYKLTALDGYMYGRGVSDNKGPVIAAIFAAAQQLQNGTLTNDIVFLIEGQEESGSGGFEDTMEKESTRALVGEIDWVMLSNSYWLDDNTPCLNYGLRGIVNVVLEITSGKPDLHAGVHGGCFREPTMDMVKLLSKVGDEGEVLIPGFYDTVRPLSQQEEALYDAITAKQGFENRKELLMKKWRYPSMTVHRVNVSGPPSGNSTVIPAWVHAQMSFRIVPDQDADTIRRSLHDHVTHTFGQLHSPNTLKVKFYNLANPWIGDPNSSAFQILRQSLVHEWGSDPLFIREGGSIPVVRYLEELFDAKAAQLPCGQASDGAHLDNERLRVTNFFKTRNVLANAFVQLKPAHVQP